MPQHTHAQQGASPTQPHTPRRPSLRTARTIGMDMDAPYGVYIDGQAVATFRTEAEALRRYERMRRCLRGRTRQLP